VRAIALDVLEAELDMEEPAELEFEAGQWVSVPFGPRNVRAYSIASTPRSPGLVTLCADVAPGGIGSLWFRGLAPGQPVEFKAPFGGFVFQRADPRRSIFVAEEIGVVPLRAILTDLQETGYAGATTLVYWGRDPRHVPYHEELVALAHRDPRFAYHPVVESADAGWSGRRGTVPEVVSAVVGDARVIAYVSGGEQMINRVREVLMARGLDRKSIKWEKFW
jgi:aquacobalamin reductase/NAD(P)H-flavin reductase